MERLGWLTVGLSFTWLTLTDFHGSPQKIRIFLSLSSNEILNVIRAARDIRSNCFSEIVQILAKWRDVDLVAEIESVVNREDIDEIENTLLQEGLLLLHGRSQCGKTTAARLLLARLRTRGFRVEIGQSVREASRVLSTTGIDDIAYLLDDPIGFNESNPALAWESLERFVSQLPPHRYLIITSRTDDLFSLLGGNSTDWCLRNSSWIDLTVTNREFLVSVWRHLAYDLSKNLIEMVEQHIMQEPNNSLLQPGQLRFLSRQRNDELMNMSQSTLISKARFNSRSLANVLISQYPAIRDVFRVLGLVATHVETSTEEDVAYILSDESIYPSKDIREFAISLTTFHLRHDESHLHAPPQYQNIQALPA